MNAHPLLTRAKLFFFISGLTALTYEVVWVRLLGLVFGNTTYAISTVLSAYMAGLGFGSYFLGRAAEKWKNPLRTYGILEGCVAVYAALTPLILMAVQAIHLALGPDLEPGSAPSIALKLALSFVVVFVPTFCMGGTLPVLIKFFLKAGKSVGSTTASLYGLNTAGAVAGTALTGFVFLPRFGVRSTLVICVALNLLVAALALLWSTRPETTPAPLVKRPVTAGATRSERWLLAALFVSGITAMLYEVSWTRVLAVVLGSSTYAFTLMLTTFLMGLALGSILFQKVLNRRAATGLDWVWLQLAVSATAMASLPFFPWVDILVVRLYGLTIGHTNLMFFLLGVVCVFFMMLPTLAFGALFAASASLYAERAPDAPRRIGRMYLCNTFGNILGSLLAGFVLIPSIGILPTLLTAVVIGATLSGLGVWAVQKKAWHNSSVFLLSVTVLIAAGVMGPDGWDKRLLSSGMHIQPGQYVSQRTEEFLSRFFNHHILYYRDGLNCTVAIGQEGGTRYLKVNGKTDASSVGDMPTQLLLGHLPLLLHPDPKRVLVIGFGSGVTLAATLAHPAVNTVECAEIEPAVIEAAPFFDDVNRAGHKDPRVRIVLNDGRNHLLTRKEKYDVIISEPSNPWMSGVSYLFTTDFYKLTSGRLNEDGVFCQWLQAYSISPEDFWMVIASVRSVFPHVTLWRTMKDDFMIIARKQPLSYDLARIQERFEESPLLRKDLRPYEIVGPAGLLSRFQLGEDSLARLTANAPLHDDDRLSLEFTSPYALYEQGEDLKEDLSKEAAKESPPFVLQTPAFLSELGAGYLGAANYAKARESFDKALKLDPNYGPALAGVGRCLGNEGRHAQAKGYFERSDTADAYSFLGRAYFRESDFTRALELLEKAETMEPDVWDHPYWKAQSYEWLERWPEALAAYRRCAVLVPKNLTIDLAIARVLRRSGDLEGAARFLEALKKEYPMHYPVYAELRMTYLALERFGTLTADFERLVELNPYFKQYWVDLIGLYMKMGEEKKLREVLKESSRRKLY